MDNLDDHENNAKVSDLGYSNSSSNSQSRSHSSKSTHSGSNSSGSSGYGGKPSTSSNSNDLREQTKKEKDLKKKKQGKTLQTDSRIEECRRKEETRKVPSREGTTADGMYSPTTIMAPPSKKYQRKKNLEEMDVSSEDTSTIKYQGGFSCIISMHDGIILYTTASITSVLGFPKDMWIGRPFIDLVHPNDRIKFASQVTNSLAVPKIDQMVDNGQIIDNQALTMVFRIRRYRGLSCGFGVKDKKVIYLPFLLKFRFENFNDDNGTTIFLVIQTVPFFSAFKTPNEVLTNVVSFVMRHNAEGILEYIDSECAPYLGYLPQDIINKDALSLYYPRDLTYLQSMYESIVKESGVTRSKPYRMIAHNGNCIKVKSEWSSFINPWSKKLDFVTGKHFVIEGPANPDVFQNPNKDLKLTEEQKNEAKNCREAIIRIMKDVKPTEMAKQQMSKRCQDLALFMDILTGKKPKTLENSKAHLPNADQNNLERDSVILGGIFSHHEYNDSKSSVEIPLSYNQLNYNENLQRYFNSHQPNGYVDNVLLPRNLVELLKSQLPESSYASPVVNNSGESAELTSSGESGGLVVIARKSHVMNLKHYEQNRLTQSLLTEHNVEMEKELMKIHREHRSFNKGENNKLSNRDKQNKEEHLARCNVNYQTIAVVNNTQLLSEKSQNLKRSSNPAEQAFVVTKHHCPSSRQLIRKHPATIPVPVQSVSTVPSTSVVKCMKYGQSSYRSPIVYTPISSQSPCFRQTVLTHGMHYDKALKPVSVARSNCKEVCVTSELIYKYQVLSKPVEEVLSTDKEKMKTFKQPKLVNEQLEQLYLDLQLEGVAARLTLEEGITSSGSSGEDIAALSQNLKNKQDNSRMVMIYEENAPLPSPEGTSSAFENDMA